MTKVTDEILASCLVEENIMPAEEAWEFIDRVKHMEEEAKEEKEKEGKLPVEYVIVVNDPNNKLPEELTGWIIQKRPDLFAYSENTEPELDEDGNPKYTCGWGDLDVESKIENYGRELKNSKGFSKKKTIFCSLGDFFEYGNKSLAKQCGLQIKTKTPVSIIGVNPDMPYWTDPGIEISYEINGMNSIDIQRG